MKTTGAAFGDQVLLLRGGAWTGVPASTWADQVMAAHSHGSARLDFMTAEHHTVRRFVVLELVRTGGPVALDTIAGGTGLALERIPDILAELEQRLFFLIRNGDGDVAWAFPFTADRTPHRLTFATGERLYAA